VNYGQALSSYITQNTFYPRRARKMKQTGVVKVKVHISADGEFHHVHLEEGCNHHILNKAAVDLIKKLGRFKPLPEPFNEGLDFVIPIQYKISRGT
jgi:protein TonB